MMLRTAILSTLHHIDLAGEWSEMSREFKEVMKDLQIQYDYCSPHDKRMNNHAENAVKCVDHQRSLSHRTLELTL